MVVMRGPEATAGSTLMALKKMGMTVPEMLESSMDSTSARPIQAETAKASAGVWALNSVR